MFKDVTVNKVAFWLSAITGMIFCILLTNFSSLSIPKSLFFSSLLFVMVFLINRYLLKVAIFNKVSYIYKVIRGAKSVDKTFNENSSLDKVNIEVANWASETKEELSKLKVLSDYRKEYVGNISHELKTPIFSIQGYLHTLLEGGIHDSNINESYLKKALQNLDRLEYIVDDLDTINHLENNKEAIQLSEYDLDEQVNKIFMELEKVAEDSEIKLICNASNLANVRVRADKRRIHQVIYNLIINSIKYGKPGGNTEISFHRMDDHFMVEVSDNGIGIAQDHLKHIFDRFYRVDHSRSRDSGGSGLGLSIVKHVLESHGQTISVRSEINKGTAFNFTLESA